ncbi:MAG TPA: ABC transporter [Gammaproteobacteria bacterium]|mgnify:FL=1|jgi:NitT/TauT family transport system substrate-binding protein|nr:ABC transporter [Gammaproteobacteria bacterium]
MKFDSLMSKLGKFLAASAIASLSFSAIPAANAAETIRVGHFSWPGYGFLYVNQHHNLSPDLNFEFTVIEDPVQLFALLGTNKLDVVFSTIEFGPILAAEDMGSKLVALSNLGYGSDDIIVHPDIKSAADLKGKQVAVLEGGLSHIMMGIWLEQNGVKWDEVEMVNLIAGDAAAAMMSGQVAAAELWAPFNTEVLENLPGSRSVANSLETQWLESGLIADAIFMSNDMLDNRRDLAVKTLQAIFKGVEHWRANSEVDNQVISDAVGFPMADVEAIIGNGKLTTEVAKNDIKDGTLYMYTLEDTARFCGVAPGSPPFGQKNGQMVDHWNLTQKWWVNFGFMTDVADPAKGLDCALVKEAL